MGVPHVMKEPEQSGNIKMIVDEKILMFLTA